MSIYDIYVKIVTHHHVRRVITHRHFVKYEKYISLILWMLAIFYLSSKTLNIFVATDIWEFIIRKLAHMFEYGVLTYLIFRILGQTEKRHMNWNLFWSFAFTVMYAISDEYHQSFVTGRHGAYQDVIIDSLGMLIALWLVHMNYHHKEVLQRKG